MPNIEKVFRTPPPYIEAALTDRINHAPPSVCVKYRFGANITKKEHTHTEFFRQARERLRKTREKKYYTIAGLLRFFVCVNKMAQLYCIRLW